MMQSERSRFRKKQQNRRDNARYNGGHRLRRLALVPFVESGLARCARGAGCVFASVVDGELVGGVIEPGSAWDLGHPDGESAGGPEHAVCNRGAPHRRRVSREW